MSNLSTSKSPMINSGNSLTAKVSREDFKSLFYLISGKPDSSIQIFTDPIHIVPNDLLELNSSIVRKLNIHSIDATITTVKIGYVGRRFHEFGTWIEFESHHWQDPDRIEEIIMKWDFLVSMQEFNIPQRHTLLVRLAPELKTGQVLQMLTAGNSDDFDEMDALSAPAFCRVDFINAQLSKELINIVSDWYKTRKKPLLISEFAYWFKERRKAIAEIIHHWFNLSAVISIIYVLLWGAKEHYAFEVPNYIVGISIFVAIYSLQPINRIAHIFGSSLYKKLSAIEGSKVVFEFTSGDKKYKSDLESNNKKNSRKFFTIAIAQVLLNIIANGFFIYLLVMFDIKTP